MGLDTLVFNAPGANGVWEQTCRLCLLVSQGAILGCPETPRFVGLGIATQTGVELRMQNLVQRQAGIPWLVARCPEAPPVPWVVWESA